MARPRLVAACGAAVLLGLATYGYIPWAASGHPYLSWGDISSLGDLVALVTRSDYGTAQLVSSSEFKGGSPLDRLAALGASFTPLQALLLMVGCAGAFRRARWYLWFSLLAVAATGPAFVAYANQAIRSQVDPPLRAALRTRGLLPEG